VDVPMLDTMPVAAYASLSCVTSAQARGQGSWCRSTQIVDGVSTGVSPLAGVARRAGRCEEGASGQGDVFGVALPFEIGEGRNRARVPSIDILSFHPGVASSGPNDNVRDVAERHAAAWYQRRSSRAATPGERWLPLAKERRVLRRRSTCSTEGDGAEDVKVYCCSSALRCASTGCDIHALLGGSDVGSASVGFGPISIVCQPHVPEIVATSNHGACHIGIAVGSDVITPDECMAVLPLVRQAFLHRLLRHLQPARPEQEREPTEALQWLESYNLRLSAKRTAKLTKKISRVADDILVSIARSQSEICQRSCPKDIVTRSISLYETMRTTNIIL